MAHRVKFLQRNRALPIDRAKPTRSPGGPHLGRGKIVLDPGHPTVLVPALTIKIIGTYRPLLGYVAIAGQGVCVDAGA